MLPEDWRLARYGLVVWCDPQMEVSALHTVLSTMRESLPQLHLTLLTSEAIDYSLLHEMRVETITLSQPPLGQSMGGSLPVRSLPSPQNGFYRKELRASDLSSPAHGISVNKGEQEEQPIRSLIQILRDHHFDAALILTTPTQSPYAWAYLCYLAGIPIRVGQSKEFGGGVLSTCISPPLDDVSTTEYYLHLLRSLGLVNTEKPQPQLAV
ncbi:hypothetical protein H6G89_07485 [Oscillatoria sp. FACHB-1407]|uniref:glycosyltransferase family 9 protein n=1 Tax=Oscillatoria sp. FACHB-1407 TaxID=2692847 RepID=UPI001685CD37|nr:hypothetical protein [Oscillatoria sp. FACHB-1407]MBD2460884.1 hypothetical protein [Oscillatoria sp. FACHB-1407]